MRKNTIPSIAARFAGLLAAVTALGIAEPSLAACGAKQRESETYRAFETCEKRRSAFSGNGIARLNSDWVSLEKSRLCSRTDILKFDKAHIALCGDPNGYVCRFQGRIMDSKCQVDIFDAKDAENTPAAVNAMCELESKWGAFMASHYPAFKTSECTAAQDESTCKSLFKLKYAQDYSKLERATVFTKTRLKRIRTLFKTVKTAFLELIRESILIPADRKALLLKEIEKTILWIDSIDEAEFLSSSLNSDCYNTAPESHPNTSVYNSDSEVHFCVGAVYSLENLNTHLLMHNIAHEIAHSIDPCSLESVVADRVVLGEPKEPSAGVAQKYFPGLIECLRGGTGPDACTNAVLHCTSEQGRSEYCHDDPDCMGHTAKRPSCTWGKPDPTLDPNSMVDYRHQGAALEQIGESFSDFIASEVLGRIIQKNQDGLSPQEQRDAIVSLASTYSRLHGGCRSSNTLDEHPPGYLRVNRIIMGSKTLRRSLGCLPDRPPRTEGAKITCKGF